MCRTEGTSRLPCVPRASAAAQGVYVAGGEHMGMRMRRASKFIGGGRITPSIGAPSWTPRSTLLDRWRGLAVGGKPEA